MEVTVFIRIDAAIMTFVGNLGYVAVAIVGSILAVAGTITVGDIQAFIQYVKNFTQPIQQMANVSNLLQSTVAAAERVFEFLEETEEVETENPMIMDHVSGAVSFEHVKFGYNEDKIIIHDFSSQVKPGSDGCNCRTYRCRKDNDGKTIDAFL